LVDEKLATFAETVKAEGWSWVEAHNEKGYVSVHEFRRIDREEVGLNREDEQELNALWAEKEAFESLERDELSAEDERRLEQIETRLDALEEKRCVWTPAQMALAGVIIALNSMGEPLVTRGLLKPDVRLPPQRREPEDADGEAMEDDQEESELEGGGDGAKKPDLSAALVLDLTAQRTAALRATLMDRPDIALISVVYALMAPVFYGRNHDTALEIRVNTSELLLKKHAADVEDGKGHKAVAARIGDWQARIPYAHHEAWGWLLEQGQETVMELLALCTACTVNATQDKYDDPMGERLTHANDLAATLRFDMTNWWEPTAAGYFMRVSREQILEAVREQDGSAVYGMMGLKKTPLAIEAGRRMAGTGWLPRMLRSKHNADAGPETLDDQDEGADGEQEF
jgi:ParB family transcriptional regulator, chromosome partitioning protein